MTTDNLDYSKAIETLENSFPPTRGFCSSTIVQQEGDKILISQNNLILELLIRTNQKLDLLLSGTPPSQNSYQDLLDKINQNLENLHIRGKKPIVSSSPQQLVVWRDPRSLFPK